MVASASPTTTASTSGSWSRIGPAWTDAWAPPTTSRSATPARAPAARVVSPKVGVNPPRPMTAGPAAAARSTTSASRSPSAGASISPTRRPAWRAAAATYSNPSGGTSDGGLGVRAGGRISSRSTPAIYQLSSSMVASRRWLVAWPGLRRIALR